ncbi:MAG: hypothetical protein HY912_20825 [Desulfomonile tiedjei]|uniref:Uncharacterized protein n=1 Tax=Desulfomonile tiedjei TaxID=2358 RepID=A0A9D6V5L7_9BACT|nr:hypothetical protein [Desulfomonile tiedjei]
MKSDSSPRMADSDITANNDFIASESSSNLSMTQGLGFGIAGAVGKGIPEISSGTNPKKSHSSGREEI